MSEYDKKVEEIKNLCEWFNDHQQEVRDSEGCVVLAIAHDDIVTNMVAGDKFMVQEMLMWLAKGVLESEGIDLGEDDYEELQ